MLTPVRDVAQLATLGVVSTVDEMPAPPADAKSPPLRLALYRLQFMPGLVRYPAPPLITNMQAMDRDKTGPWCGPPL